MADAIVLITTQADKVSEAAKKIVEIPGVKDVYSVAGDVDLVAIVSPTISTTSRRSFPTASPRFPASPARRR